MTRLPLSWVFDTNVVISALINPSGNPGRLLDMVLAGALRLTCDDRIGAEYREVMSRPHFNIPRERSAAFLAFLPFEDTVVALPWQRTRPPDEDDIMFLEVALASRDRTLVTGNLKHFPASCRGPIRILSPAEAWMELATMS